MATPPPIPSSAPVRKSIHHIAADVSMYAVMVALALYLLWRFISVPLDEKGQLVVGGIMVAIFGFVIIVGLISGIVALCGLPRYGRKGIFVRALCGVLLPVGILFASIPAIMAASSRAEKMAQSYVVDTQLAKAAAAVSKQAPMMIDEATRLMGAEVRPGRTFVYLYTVVNTTKATFPPDALGTIRQDLLEVYKKNPDMKPFRDLGVTVIYSYSDPAGELLGEVTILPTDTK